MELKYLIYFRHFFNCERSKKCIPFYQHCDGILDCLYGEDENNCTKCNQTSSFRCSSNSKCITINDLCNNINDCSLGEDENEIICGHFCEWPSLNTCTSRRKLLLKENICGFLNRKISKFMF
jgi:hypothetical protein